LVGSWLVVLVGRWLLGAWFLVAWWLLGGCLVAAWLSVYPWIAALDVSVYPETDCTRTETCRRFGIEEGIDEANN